MADELLDTIGKWAIGVATAVTILGPPLALFIRRIRSALRGEEEKSERLEAQRDALVVGHQDALDELSARSPATAKLVRDKLKGAQEAAGVQSDVAKLVDAEREVRRERKTPVVPLPRPEVPPIEPAP